MCVLFGRRRGRWRLPPSPALWLIAVSFGRRAFSSGIATYPRQDIVICVTGMFSVWIAIGAPLAYRSDEFLSIHMVQHLLLVAIGAPVFSGCHNSLTRSLVRI